MNGIPGEGKPDLQRSDLFLIATGSLLVGVGLLIPVAVGWMLGEQVSSLPDVFRAGPPVTILALGFGGAILCIASARIRARYGKDHEAEAVASPGTAWQCGCGVTNTGSRTKCRACGTPIGGVWTPEAAKGLLGTGERIRSFGVIALGLCAILAALWATSWSLGRRQWGPFRGQIVDVETGQPIEGAAVVVVWWVTIPTPVHDVRSFYDAREAVTDAEGRFKAPGRWPAIFWLMVQKSQLSYYAPGYVAHAVTVTPPDGRPFVDPTLIQMRRAKTRYEMSRSRSGPSLPWERLLEIRKAVNAKRKKLGLGPLWPE